MSKKKRKLRKRGMKERKKEEEKGLRKRTDLRAGA